MARSEAGECVGSTGGMERLKSEFRMGHNFLGFLEFLEIRDLLYDMFNVGGLEEAANPKLLTFDGKAIKPQ